jgi:hypothetical protein
MSSHQGPKGDKGDTGAQGAQGVPGPESKLAQAASREVERLIKAKTTPKWWGKLIVVVCLVLATVVGYLVYKDVTHPNSTALQEQIVKENTAQYQSCVSGNVTRANEILVWDHFIGLLTEGNKNPAVTTEAQHFESFVASIYAPRDCAKIYNVTPVNPAG